MTPTGTEEHRSLRRMLVSGAVLATTVILLVAGVVLDWLTQSTLRAEFDAGLVARARAIAALVEAGDEGLEVEPLAGFQSYDEPFRITTESRAVIAENPAGDPAYAIRPPAALDVASAAVDSPRFADGLMPRRDRGRFIALRFVPRADLEHTEMPKSAPVLLVLARSVSALEGTLLTVRFVLAGVGAATLLALSLVLRGIVNRALVPVDHLGSAIAALSPSDLATRLQVPGLPRELAPVVERLNELLDRLDAAFGRERRFTGDAAHELRTPIAGLRAKLELAAMRPESAGDTARLTDDLLPIVLRMQRLVESLLQLARADAGRLEGQQSAVNLAAFARQRWELIADRAAERGLRVEWVGGPCEIVTIVEWLAIVLDNLFDNAVSHCDRGGAIGVEVVASDDSATISVFNSGCRLASADGDRVFERFWRGDPARGLEDGHSGVGLALCAAVVARLDGTISANLETPGWFAVRVRLPRALP